MRASQYLSCQLREQLRNRHRLQRARAADDTRHMTLQKFDRLTTREREIAQFMIANPSNTASKEIGRELNISPRTVDHHRARILEKMGIHSVAELIDLSLSVPDVAGTVRQK